MGQFMVLCFDYTSFRPLASPMCEHIDKSMEQIPIRGYNDLDG